MMGMLVFLTISASAQKHIESYDPEALFNEGVLLFQNQEYGAALPPSHNTAPKPPNPSRNASSTRSITKPSAPFILVMQTVPPK